MNTEDNWETVKFKEAKPAKVRSLKVQKGDTIVVGQILILYGFDDEPTPSSSPPSTPEDKNVSLTNNGGNSGSHAHHNHQHHHQLHKNVVRATKVGTVENVLVKAGDVLTPGTFVIEFSSCKHPIVMKDMCAECGADLRDEMNRNQTAAVAMVHNIPELMVSVEQAQVLGKADEERLMKQRQLVLLVDLDQTLIHTTNDNIPSNLKDVFSFQLHGTNSPWYHTRLRPGTHEFLERISKFYELHICTFGSRTYAHMIASFLDQGGKYFSHRILSRDECFNPSSKMANMKALFPCGDHMVVIIDDRDDVWNFAPNLIHVKPYHFFQHTGDINAPPGLAKREFDDKQGFDIAHLEEEVKKSQEDSTAKKEKDAKLNKEEREKKENDSEKCEEISSEEKGKDAHDVQESEKSQEVNTESSDSELNRPSESAKSEKVNSEEEGKEEHSPANTAEKESKNEKAEDSNTADVDKPSEMPTDDTRVDVHDPDDYLLHLEDILKTIHNAYYTMYDQMKAENSSERPDMRTIIPYVRRKVLQGVNLVFSGVIPTMAPLEKSRPYLVAKSLGAHVTEKIISKQENTTEATTHLVAARLGTAKIHEAKKCKNVHIVTPDWLWSCAERWERVDERLFPLDKSTSVHRKPPPHCSSPDVALQLARQLQDPDKRGPGSGNKKPEPVADFPVYDPKTGKRVRARQAALRAAPSDKRRPSFSDTINPLMSFSTEDIADMDREVEDILNEGGIEEDEDDTDEENRAQDRQYAEDVGIKRKRADLDEEDEELSEKFIKGETMPADVQDLFADEGQENEEVNDETTNDLGEDPEWKDMAAALEREFLEEGE